MTRLMVSKNTELNSELASLFFISVMLLSFEPAKSIIAFSLGILVLLGLLLRRYCKVIIRKNYSILLTTLSIGIFYYFLGSCLILTSMTFLVSVLQGIIFLNTKLRTLSSTKRGG